MHCYIFADENCLKLAGITRAEVQELVEKIAVGTDTQDLVVSIYFLKSGRWSGGCAYVRQWLSPKQFRTRRGHWRFTQDFPLPDDLPEKFKLIRLLPTKMNMHEFPGQLIDGYGWQFHFERLIDRLALLFAHELHHFRRFHLNLHPGEGEQSANRWALEQVQNLGYQVSGKMVVQRHVFRKKRRALLKQIYDPYTEFRKLLPGNKVYIRYDPHGRYHDSIATVERPIRINSKRIAIRTNDEKRWLWPMEWLQPINQSS